MCAEDFCNSIWDGSFYVPMDNSNNTNCVSFTFETIDNPNRKVFEYYKVSNMSLLISSVYTIIFSIFISLNFLIVSILNINIFI